MARGLRFQIRAQDQTRQAFAGVNRNLRTTQGLQRSWNAGLNSNRRAVQQFGFQMSDFAIQIAGGQSAMLAFTQQGGQMLQFFGPAGAISAAFLAVFGSLAIAFTRSGAALSELTPILGVLQDEFVLIGQALSATKDIMIDFANLVVNNFDRILITASVLAGFFAARWVAAFIAARVATFTLVGALGALRAILLRLGFTAIIIGIGEVIYQFTRLVEATGSVREALAIVGRFAVEVVDRMIQAFRLIPVAASTAADGIRAWFLSGFAAVAQAFANLIQGMVSGLNSFAQTAGNFISDLGGIPNIFRPDFSIGTEWVDNMQTSVGDLRTTAIDAFDALSSSRDLLNAGLESLARPFDTVAEIRELLDGLPDDAEIDVRDWFTGSGDAEDVGGGGASPGGGAAAAEDEADETADAIKRIFDDMSSSISQSMMTSFQALRSGTKSLAEATQDALVGIFNKIQDVMLQPVWDFIGRSVSGYILGTPGATGFSGGLFSNAFNSVNSLRSFAGGGYTGRGSRSGGVDGKGGQLTVTHPRETIIDETLAGNGGGAAPVEVHIHENSAPGDEHQVTQSSGRIDVHLRRAVKETFQNGHMDASMRMLFGLQRKST